MKVLSLCITVFFLNINLLQSQSKKEQADSLMKLAHKQKEKGKFGKAKANYLNAVLLDKTKTYEAYTAIGDMYMDSNCIGIVVGGDKLQNKESNPCRKKAKYIAAYNMYLKAGNAIKANKAKELSPTKAEFFNYAMSEKQVRLECWINETFYIPRL